jgi:hypothetical protein
MEYISGSKLRKLFGRAERGGSTRRNIKLTITPSTVDMVDQVVGFGNGKYGSSYFEMSARLMTALITEGDYIDDIAIELKKTCDSPYLARNLERLKRLLEA